MNVVLHSDDINLLSHWEKSLDRKCEIVDDLNDLKTMRDKVIIINYSAFNSNQKDFLRLLEENANQVLVLHRTPDIGTAREVLGYGAKGYGNALMKGHFLAFAIESVKDGMVWLHPEFTSQLIAQIPAQEDKNLSRILDKLSQREKEVAILLKDGNSYKEISEKLSVTPRTVKAHAHNVYAKLHVKDRLALALLLR